MCNIIVVLQNNQLLEMECLQHKYVVIKQGWKIEREIRGATKLFEILAWPFGLGKRGREGLGVVIFLEHHKREKGEPRWRERWRTTNKPKENQKANAI